MKPSEMLNKMGYLNLKRKLNKSEIKELNDLGIIEKEVIKKLLKKANNDLDKMDKRFIDREELKDKINNEFELHRTIFKCKAIFTEKGFNNLKKKILELI